MKNMVLRRWEGTDRDIYKGWIDFRDGGGKKGDLEPVEGRCYAAYRCLRAMMLGSTDKVAGIPDRVPVWCMSSTFGAKMVNADLGTYASSGKLISDAQIALVEKVGVDAVVPFADIGSIAEAWGTKTSFDPVPHTSEYVVKKPEDWLGLDYIRDIEWKESGRVGAVFEACEICFDKFGFAIPIYGVIPSPLTLACWLGGVERVKADMVRSPELLHKGLSEITDSMIELVKAYFDANLITLILDCAHASGNVFNPVEYIEFGAPYDLKMLNRCKTFMSFIAHVHGNEPFLDLLANLYPIIALNWDTGGDYKLSDAKQAFSTKVALAGGVSQKTMLSGSASDVEAEALSAIKDAASGGGFILAPGSELTYATPEENVAAMVNAAKKYGQYPL